jgi:hypothetical protein
MKESVAVDNVKDWQVTRAVTLGPSVGVGTGGVVCNNNNNRSWVGFAGLVLQRPAEDRGTFCMWGPQQACVHVDGAEKTSGRLSGYGTRSVGST